MVTYIMNGDNLVKCVQALCVPDKIYTMIKVEYHANENPLKNSEKIAMLV